MTRNSQQKKPKALEGRQDNDRVSKENDKPSWRRAIEKYADDEDILAVLAEGMRLREAERRKVRTKKS